MQEAFDPNQIHPPFVPVTFTYGSLELVAPAIELFTTSDPIICHWGNTLVRCFRFAPQFDHIEYYQEEGQAPQGIHADSRLIAAFIAHAYPVRYDPFVDRATIDWYAQYVEEGHDLDSELDDFLGGLGE